MKIIHHFSTTDPAQLLRRQAAIHRKCLLLLRARRERVSHTAG